jgi:hypothetical protein
MSARVEDFFDEDLLAIQSLLITIAALWGAYRLARAVVEDDDDTHQLAEAVLAGDADRYPPQRPINTARALSHALIAHRWKTLTSDRQSHLLVQLKPEEERMLRGLLAGWAEFAIPPEAES